MKSILKRTLVISLIFAFLVCSVLTFVFRKTENVNAEIAINNESIADYYVFNESKVFPKEISVDYLGKTYQATKGIVEFPSGVTQKIGDEPIELSYVGKSYAKYYFTSDAGEFVTAVDDFIVSDNKFNFTMNNGSSVTIADESTEVCENNTSDVLYTGQKGMILRLNEGSSFKYNVPIDLSKGNDEGLCEIMTVDPRLNRVSYSGNELTDVDGYVIDENGNFKLDAFNKKYKNKGDEVYRMGGLVAENVIITLTDCYDSTKYIQVVVDCQDEAYAGLTYLRGKLAGSSHSYGGFSKSDKAPQSYQVVAYQDGVRGLASINRFGIYHSGKVYIKTAQPFSVVYDNETNRLYYTRSTSKKLIVDFSNTSIHGANAFKGFTTGEVYLSIEVENYLQHEPARVDILSIGGSVDNATNLNDSVYVDTVKPIVDVELNKTNDFGVYAAKGETFVLPKAKVTDVNYSGNLSVRVYRNYGLNNQSMVSVVNNTFKVDYADTYTVVYRAIDDFGNVGEASFKVVALNKESSLKLNVDKLDNLYFGEYNVLPNYELETLNKTESLKINVYAIFNGEKIEIDKDSLAFKPNQLGEYEILYTFSDNVNSKEFSYKVNSVGRNNVVFAERPDVYSYYIKDAEYAFNQLNALAKQSDGSYSKAIADLYVAFDGGEFSKVDINKVKITGNETISVKFIYNDVSSDIITAKIVDVGYADETNGLRIKDYFDGDFTVKTLEDDGETVISDITYDSNVLTGNNTLKFINPISYQNYKFEYIIPEGKDNFSKLNIKLTDRENIDKTVVISIRNTGAEGMASVNGSAEFGIGEKFSGGYAITVRYYYDRSYFYIGTTKYVLDSGFNGDSAYFEVEMEGIYGKSSINVKTVNNVNFNNYNNSDNINPEIWFEKYYGQYEINQELTLAPIVAMDVLSPINLESKRLKVTIKGNGDSASDKYATDKDGKILNGKSLCDGNVTLILSEYGTYTVTYQVSDAFGNSTSINYKFNVVDKVAPTITLNGDFDENNPQTIKAGRTVKVEYSVSDNLTANEQLYTQVNLYDNRLGSILVNVGNEIKIDKAGEYTLYIYSVDADGNSAYRYYKIIVE